MFSQDLNGPLPITWEIEKIKELDWYLPAYKNKEGCQKAFDLGYTWDHLNLYRTPFSDVSKQPELKETLKHFPNFEKAMIWFQKQKPGAAVSTHKDPCLPNMYNMYWGSDHGIPEDKFRRAIVYLEDHKDGHLNTIDGRAFYSWKAGNYLWWDNQTPHSAVNFGTEDKIVMVVDYYDI